MARWGLCSGCVLGVAAVVAVIVAMWRRDGAVAWFGWGLFALFAWGAVMSIYTFDRPSPTPPARPLLPRKFGGWLPTNPKTEDEHDEARRDRN